MRWHGVFLMLAVAVIVNCALCAPVRRASHDLMDLSLRKLLDSLADTTLPLPSQLSTGREVFLFIRAGAAVLDVRVVAKASMSPEKVAHALAQALEGTEFAGETIEWSQGDEFTVVRLLIERGRFGRRHAQLTVPVGRLVVGLKRAGLVPHALLRLPKHVHAPALPFPKEERRFWVQYAVSNASPDFQVTTSANVTTVGIVLLLLFVAFVPMVTTLSLVLAVLIACWQRLPIERRRWLYPKLVIYPTFAAILCHAPLAIFVISFSPYPRTISDVWFGTLQPSTILGPTVTLALLPCLLAFWLTVPIEWKLFGRPEEKLLAMEKRKDLLAKMAVDIFLSLVRNWRQQRQAWRQDDELEQQVKALALQLGITNPPKVMVDESPDGREHTFIFALPSAVIISRKSLEMLTPEELRCVLAHELAHLKLRHLSRRFPLLFLCVALFSLSPLTFAVLPMRDRWLPAVDPVWLITVGIFLAPTFALFLLFFGTRWISRRQEFEADRMALEVTRNLDGIVSALTKLAQHSPMPYLVEVEDLSTHPALSHRIERLRQIAKELGIADE
jgi:Zn-dependent protease with chaperone function